MTVVVARWLALAAWLPVVFGAEETMYHNPVIRADTPDPGVLSFNGRYYVVATSANNSVTEKYPIYESSNLVDYSFVGYVFPTAESRPTWAVMDYWAPEIHVVPLSGSMLAYFTARNTEGRLCIGVAESLSGTPAGPFQDSGACIVEHNYHGIIDATFFYDAPSNSQWLLFKLDGNDKGEPTPIYIAKLDESGKQVVGDWIELIRNDEEWESMLVEAPWLIRYEDAYYLTFSGSMGFYYAVGVAKSTSLTGPYTKFAGNPMLHTDYEKTPEPSHVPGLVGPGHSSMLETAPGSWVMWYHVWPNDVEINFSQTRYTAMDAVQWKEVDGELWPIIEGSVPSESFVPVPDY
jgi:beta-xylosidase